MEKEDEMSLERGWCSAAISSRVCIYPSFQRSVLGWGKWGGCGRHSLDVAGVIGHQKISRTRQADPHGWNANHRKRYHGSFTSTQMIPQPHISKPIVNLNKVPTASLQLYLHSRQASRPLPSSQSH